MEVVHAVITDESGLQRDEADILVVKTNDDGDLEQMECVSHEEVMQVMLVRVRLESSLFFVIQVHEEVIAVVQTPDRPYGCSFCAYRSARKDTLNNHVNSVHRKIKPFECVTCSFKTSRRGTLIRHARIVHKTKLSTSEGSRRGSSRIHSGLRQLVCPLCNFKSQSQAEFKEHVDSVHTTDKSSTNQTSVIVSKDGMNIFVIEDVGHDSQVSTSPEHKSEFPCQSCEYLAPNQYKLKSHVKVVHLKQKPFRCEVE